MSNDDFDCPKCGNGHLRFLSGKSKKPPYRKYAFWACSNYKGKCDYTTNTNPKKGQQEEVERRNFHKPSVVLTAEQQAIVNMAEELKKPGGRNLVIAAKAGTGKTFCLEMLAWELLER